MSQLLIDIDEQLAGKHPSPVTLGMEFIFQKKRCKVIKRFEHAFYYDIIGEAPPPMHKCNQITYAYWNKWVGKKIQRCNP